MLYSQNHQSFPKLSKAMENYGVEDAVITLLPLNISIPQKKEIILSLKEYLFSHMLMTGSKRRIFQML